MIVIAFSGKRESGKDTGAQHLGREYLSKYAPFGLPSARWPSKQPKKLAMADPLKKFVSQWFGIPIEWCNTQEGKNTLTHLRWDEVPADVTQEAGPDYPFMKVREVLQIWGTEILRAADPNCHLRRWAQEAEALQKGGCPLLFVPDVRFPNEVEGVLDFSPKSYIIRLTRQVHEDSHESERALEDYEWHQWGDRTFLVDNASQSLEEYQTALEGILQGLVVTHQGCNR